MFQILFIDLAVLIVILDLSKIELGLTDAREGRNKSVLRHPFCIPLIFNSDPYTHKWK